MPAHFTPDRSTAPHLPVLMLRPTKARQLPSLELGKPPKLQPQPKSQLQNSYPCPLSVHLVFVALAVAIVDPPLRVGSSPSDTAGSSVASAEAGAHSRRHPATPRHRPDRTGHWASRSR